MKRKLAIFLLLPMCALTSCYSGPKATVATNFHSSRYSSAPDDVTDLLLERPIMDFLNVGKMGEDCIFYFGSKSCSWCQKLNPIFSKYVFKHQMEIYWWNTATIDPKTDIDTLALIYDYYGKSFNPDITTPAFYFISNHKIVRSALDPSQFLTSSSFANLFDRTTKRISYTYGVRDYSDFNKVISDNKTVEVISYVRDSEKYASFYEETIKPYINKSNKDKVIVVFKSEEVSDTEKEQFEQDSKYDGLFTNDVFYTKFVDGERITSSADLDTIKAYLE